MMIFRLIFVFFILFPNYVIANDIKIIELHKSKSLDQLVLESSNSDEEFQNDTELLDENNQLDVSNKENESETNPEELLDADVVDEQVILIKKESIFNLDQNMFENHIESIKNIQSQVLYKEFLRILSDTELSDENITEDKIYFVIKKLYELGEIEKAYNLIKNKNDIINILNEESLSYFYLIELNYLFSTFKLSEVCMLKSLLSDKSVNLPNFLLEKTDIFCLTLENNLTEAKLLNSLLLDSEKETDKNFQKLFEYMTNENENNNFEPLKMIKNKELIFLYSAMLRINELGLDENFIDIDPLNLTVPVILSNSTNMDIRIKAANKAYYDQLISIESLAALYQSADFNSKDFINPDQTILSLNNNKELIMAFYFQLVNIQIFPDQRFDAILKYWQYAQDIGLEKIAYAITKNIIDKFEPNAQNTQYGIEMAIAHISNRNFTEASKWINLNENSSNKNAKLDYAKFLLTLNQSNELNTIIDYLSKNYNGFKHSTDQNTNETLHILMKFLNIDTDNYEHSYKIMIDERLMPSYFLLRDLERNIQDQKDKSFFILSLISINNKKWNQLHPEHLILILDAYKLYNQGSLLQPIIIEILNELEFFNE